MSLGRCWKGLALFCIVSSIVAAFVLLAVWIALSSNHPVVSVENAYLTGFNLTATAGNAYGLQYNLTVAFGLRNGNKKHTLCYRGLEAEAYYGHERLSSASLLDLCQGSKTSSTATTAFSGSKPVEFLPAQVGFFANEKETGSFRVTVSLKGKLRARLETAKWIYTAELDQRCWLTVPVVANSTSPAAFTRTHCADVRPPPPPVI